MKVYTVIGLSCKELEEIEKELGILADVDKGFVYFLKVPEGMSGKRLFLDTVKEKCGVTLPSDYDKINLFGNDGDQDFDFYIGIMF